MNWINKWFKKKPNLSPEKIKDLELAKVSEFLNRYDVWPSVKFDWNTGEFTVHQNPNLFISIIIYINCDREMINKLVDKYIQELKNAYLKHNLICNKKERLLKKIDVDFGE